MAAGADLREREFAPAKINLALHVTDRRDDGYHDLDTLVVFADSGDQLSARPVSDTISLTVDGPFASALAAATLPGENLIERGADALRRFCGIGAGAEILLTKAVPLGAGIGGGSADAAAGLRLLNRVWGNPVSVDALAVIAEKLGADVPMCLASVPLRASGKGDRIEPLAGMPALPMVLAYPDTAIETAAIFSRRPPSFDPPLPPLPPRFVSPADLCDWLRQTRNGLEETSIGIAPAIGEALASLRGLQGCLLARMSGSGSACFGIFGSAAEARAAGDQLALARPDWWIASTMSSHS